MCDFIRSPPLITRTTFSYNLEGNWVGFLLQRWRYHKSVGKNVLAVSIYKGGLLTGHAKHHYLIMKSTDISNSLIHCKKIISKGTGLTQSLIFGNPINWSFIHENNESSSWSSSNRVSIVIAINIYSHPESQFSGLRHIISQIFFNRPVNTWRPVLTFEVFVSIRRFTWMK